jgi:hypothetical protein
MESEPHGTNQRRGGMLRREDWMAIQAKVERGVYRRNVAVLAT